MNPPQSRGISALLRRVWPYLLFISLVILYFFPVLFQGRVMLFNDLYSQHYPSAEWAYRVLKQGHLPVWVGSIFSGFPIVDQGMVGLYNPVQFILFMCFRSVPAYHLNIAAFFLLPLIFTYLFARRLALDRLPATISALTFVFGGFYITRVVHMTVGNTMQYFPLGLYFIERSFQSRSRALWWVSLIIGLQILAGYPQYLFFSVFAYSFYFMFRCLLIRPWRTGRLFRALVLWIVVVAIGLGIGCIQFIPSQILVSQHSHRQGGFDYETAAEQSYVPWHLVTYLFPNFYGWGNPVQNLGFWQTGGNYWEQACYVGIMPLLLALFSLRNFKRNVYVRIFWLLAAVSFLLALGRYTPLFAGMRLIRNYRFFRMPIRWTIVTSFSLAMLAGLGLADVLQNPRELWKRFGARFLAVFRWLLIGLLLLLIAANLLFSWGRGALYDAGLRFGDGFAVRKAENAGPSSKSIEEYRAILARFLAETLDLAFATVRLTNPHIFLPLLLLACSYALLAWVILGRGPPAGFGTAVLALTLADLAHFGLRYNPAFDAAEMLSPPATAVFLKQDASRYRIYQYRFGPAFSNLRYWRELLKPNIHMLWGLDSATGYFPLRFKRADALDRLVGDLLASPGREEVGLKIMGMMNVKYILTGEWAAPPSAPAVYQDGIVRIYRNPNWLPRAFLVGSCRSSSPEVILNGLRRGELDLARSAWVEGDPGEISLSPSDSAEIVSWEDRRAVVHVRAASRTLLFLSIPHYPGWSARVDSAPAELFRADYLFLAVAVPSGVHTVEVAFRSEAFRPGLLLTGASALVLCLLLAWGPRNRFIA